MNNSWIIIRKLHGGQQARRSEENAARYIAESDEHGREPCYFHVNNRNF